MALRILTDSTCSCIYSPFHRPKNKTIGGLQRPFVFETARIAEHKARRGAGWQTVEAPHDLAGALGKVPAGAPVLIDCLTLGALYTLRIVAGWAAAGLAASFWLLAFSLFLFLSLAMVKRSSGRVNATAHAAARLAGVPVPRRRLRPGPRPAGPAPRDHPPPKEPERPRGQPTPKLR